jgi:hypothetical protein
MYFSEWTGQQLAECSLYGVRVYKEGAVLATHVDRKLLFACHISHVQSLRSITLRQSVILLQAYRWSAQLLSMWTKTWMNHG